MGYKKERKKEKRNKREREIEFRERKAKRNKLVAILTVITVLIAVSIYFALSGGGGSPTSTSTSQPSGPKSTPVPAAQQPSGPIKATWIEPQVAGDTVSIPVSEVNDNKIVHFNVAVALGSEMAFMAYDIDGKLNVRANVCPPCRSIGFSLDKDTLICDTCQTTFKAKTGDGISGACVDYPKATVAYEISDGKVVMRGNDLLTAYKSTDEPGWP